MMVISIVWIVFIHLEQKTNLSHIKKSMKIKIFCTVGMSPEKNMILEFIQYLKSARVPSIIYADLESLIKKT